MIPMLEEKIAQIHFWPWSVYVPEETCDLKEGGVSFGYFGSPIISISAEAIVHLSVRYERLLQLGPCYQGPRGNYKIFEMPHGMLSTTLPVSLVVSKHQHRIDCQVTSHGARPRYEQIADADKPIETPLARIVVAWSQFFDDLMENASYVSEGGKRLAWRNIVDYIRTLSEEQQEPPKALIIEIAERMHRRLPEIIPGLRKILLRERAFLNVGRIEELDNTCICWLTQQPGTTVAEKAGPKQQVMAIRRRETFDLHENRIVKDFLQRCTSECIRYIEAEIGQSHVYKQSSRYQLAASFHALCCRLCRETVFAAVSKPVPGTPPNYVLLSDLRYREVWRWYVRLLRREEEEDRSWVWQTRTWADIVRLLVNSAISGVFAVEGTSRVVSGNGITVEPLLHSLLHIRKKQLLGVRTYAGSEPGPFVVTSWRDQKSSRKAVLEIVHPDLAEHHSIIRWVGQLGAHLYLVLQPLNKSDDPVQIIAVWAVHAAGSEKEIDLRCLSESAFRGLERHQVLIEACRFHKQMHLEALVVQSSLGATQTTVFADSLTVPVVSVPASPKFWYEALVEIAALLDDMFRRVLR